MLTPEQRKEINETFKRIGEVHGRQSKPKPVVYEAWSFADRPRSRQWLMRGAKGCEKCEGNGYEFADLGGDAWGWIRCTSCQMKFVTQGEIGKNQQLLPS